MRSFAGTLATVFSVVLLALGLATFTNSGFSAIGAGVLGAGFGTLFTGWHLLTERRVD